MYLTVETLSLEFYNIVKEKYGEKDLYKVEEIVRAVEDKLDDLYNKIDELREKINDMESKEWQW